MTRRRWRVCVLWLMTLLLSIVGTVPGLQLFGGPKWLQPRTADAYDVTNWTNGSMTIAAPADNTQTIKSWDAPAGSKIKNFTLNYSIRAASASQPTTATDSITVQYRTCPSCSYYNVSGYAFGIGEDQSQTLDMTPYNATGVRVLYNAGRHDTGAIYVYNGAGGTNAYSNYYYAPSGKTISRVYVTLEKASSDIVYVYQYNSSGSSLGTITVAGSGVSTYADWVPLATGATQVRLRFYRSGSASGCECAEITQVDVGGSIVTPATPEPYPAGADVPVITSIESPYDPTTPTLAASSGPTPYQQTVNWTHSGTSGTNSAGTNYELWRQTLSSNGSTLKDERLYSGTALTFTTADQVAGTYYQYRVRAKSSASANMLSRPWFADAETTTTDYLAAINGATLTRDVSTKWEGSAAYKVTATKNGTTSLYTTDHAPVSGGKSYTFSVYTKSNIATSRNVQALIWWKDQAGQTITAAGGDLKAITSASFQRVSATGVAPPNATEARVELYFQNALATEAFWWDGAQLEEASTASVYADPPKYSEFSPEVGYWTAPMPTVAPITSGLRVSYPAVYPGRTYRIYYRVAPTGSWSSVTTSSTTYDIMGLSPGSNYNLQVEPVLASGGTLWRSGNATANFAPIYHAPSETLSLNQTPTGHTFYWRVDGTNIPTGTVTYRIYRNGVLLNEAARSASYQYLTGTTGYYYWVSFADSGLTTGLRYDYEVCAVNAAGVCGPMATLSYTPVPNVPTSFALSSSTNGLTSGNVSMTWNANGNAAGTVYEVWRKNWNPDGSLNTVTNPVPLLDDNPTTTVNQVWTTSSATLTANGTHMVLDSTTNSYGYLYGPTYALPTANGWPLVLEWEGQLTKPTSGYTQFGFESFYVQAHPSYTNTRFYSPSGGWVDLGSDLSTADHTYKILLYKDRVELRVNGTQRVSTTHGVSANQQLRGVIYTPGRALKLDWVKVTLDDLAPSSFERIYSGTGTSFTTTDQTPGHYYSHSVRAMSPEHNLLTANQSNAEANSTGMSTWHSLPAPYPTLSRDTVTRRSGGAAHKATAVANTTTYLNTASGPSAVNEGEIYTFELWAKLGTIGTGKTLTPEIKWLDAQGETVGNTVGAKYTPTNTNFNLLTVTGKVPANATQAYVMVAHEGAQIGHSVWWDDARFFAVRSSAFTFDLNYHIMPTPTVTQQNNVLKVDWDTIYPSLYYSVQYAQENGTTGAVGTWTGQQNTTASTTSWNLSPLYRYQVRLLPYSLPNGGPSWPISDGEWYSPLWPKVEYLQFSSAGQTSVTLNWPNQALHNSAVIRVMRDGVEVYRGVPSTYNYVSSVPGYGARYVATWSDSGLNPGQQYSYQICALNGKGECGTPETQTFTTLPPTPDSAQADIQFGSYKWSTAATNGGWAEISYRAVRTATSYKLYVSGPETRTITLSQAPAEGAIIKHRLTDLQSGGNYSFRVSAVNATGEGSQSNAMTFTTPTRGDASAPTAHPVLINEGAATTGGTRVRVRGTATDTLSGVAGMQIANSSSGPWTATMPLQDFTKTNLVVYHSANSFFTDLGGWTSDTNLWAKTNTDAQAQQGGRSATIRNDVAGSRLGIRTAEALNVTAGRDYTFSIRYRTNSLTSGSVGVYGNWTGAGGAAIDRTLTASSTYRTETWTITAPTGATARSLILGFTSANVGAELIVDYIVINEGPTGISPINTVSAQVTGVGEFNIDGSSFGAKTVFVRFVDMAGNTSSPVSASIQFMLTDTTAPKVALLVNGTASGGTTSSTSVSLSISATDAESSVDMLKMRFRNESNGVWSNWEDYSTIKIWTICTGQTPGTCEGQRTIWVEVQDPAMNVGGATASVFFRQSAAPQIDTATVWATTGSSGNYNTGAGTVAVQFQRLTEATLQLDLARLPGVSTVRYGFDPNRLGQWETVSATKTLSLPNVQGIQTLYIQTNTGQQFQHRFLLDYTAPELNVSWAGGATMTRPGGKATLTIDAYDNLARNEDLTVSINGGAFVAWQPEMEITLMGTGLKNVSIRLRDPAGNTTQKALSVFATP